jgi:mRNA-degrading endonuclease RelE of RelBE toxin-antitoxin system
MQLQRTKRFDDSFIKLDKHAQKAIQKALTFMVYDLHYPSLRVKKMKGKDDIFEASASMDIRITFHIEESEILVLRNCGHHDKTLGNP